MTQTENQIEIPLSKKKLILMLIGSLGFVAAGFWFVIKPPVIDNPFFGNPTTVLWSGISSILFFGLCAFYLIRKLPDNKPGLIIDIEGFIDNSSAVAAGKVLWNDVVNISEIEMHRQKIILLEVSNPQEYIDRQTSSFKRKIMEMNYNSYGSPISITANSLQIKYDELIRVLTEHLDTSRQ